MHINIRKRHHDFIAYIEGDERYWGVGRTPDEAIGSAIRSHAERFSLKIVYEVP